MQKVKEIIEKKNIIGFFDKHYVWMFSIFTGFLTFMVFVTKFLSNSLTRTYADYYGLDEIFLFADTFWYYILVGLILLILHYFIFSGLNSIFKKKNILFEIIIVVLANYFSIKLLISFDNGFCISLLSAISISIIEGFFEFVLVRGETKTDGYIQTLDNTRLIKSFILLVLVLLFFLFQSFNIILTTNLKSLKEYRFIDDNTIVIYSTKEYYILLNCKIQNNEQLTIYKGSQNKIVNDNVQTYLKTFKNVDLVSE